MRFGVATGVLVAVLLGAKQHVHYPSSSRPAVQSPADTHLLPITRAADSHTNLGAKVEVAGPTAEPLYNGLLPYDPIGTPAKLLDAAGCITCHAETGALWRVSGHARAFVNPVFQAAYAIEKQTFCRDCHAPLAATVPTHTNEGVSCVVCHVKEGRVLTANVPTPKGERAHPMARDERLKTELACQGCHEFHFPGLTDDGSEADFMQKTISEWRNSPSFIRGDTCSTCHLTRLSTGQKDHRMSGVNAARLAKAVGVTVATIRLDAQRVEVQVTLTSDRVGHAVPSGDLFRQLRVTAGTTVVHPEATIILTRVWRTISMTDESGPFSSRRTLRDDRLQTGEVKTLKLQIHAKPGDLVYYKVDHLRMPVELAEKSKIASNVNETTVNHGNVLAP